MNLRFQLACITVFATVLLANLFGQTEGLEFDEWIFPEFSWKEEDFQNRFLGRYGVNGFTEPQMDVENYNVYEGAMALVEDKAEAIAYLRQRIQGLDESGVESSAALHFVLASMLYETGEKVASTEAYVQAIRKHPSFLRAYANLGFTFMELGEGEKALPVLLKAVELGANESQIHGLIGRIYYSKKLYESGLTSYRLALVFHPENNAWRFGALQCLIGLERFEEAITLADEVLAFDRRNPGNWRNRAGLLIRLERWDDAIVDFRTAHALGGATLNSHLSVAQLLFNKGVYQEAVKSLSEAIPLAEDVEDFERLLAVAQALSNVGKIDAVLALAPALEERAATRSVLMDTRPFQRIRAAKALRSEAYAEALSLLEPLIEADPGNGELLLMKAQTLAGLGDVEAAIFSFQIAETIEESAYAARYEHARLELSRGRLGSALKLLRAAYALQSSESLRSYIRELEELEAAQP